ncbi:hypothetical protein PMIN07_004838 [Paraphaeosphaeria minitans]
MSCWRVLQLSDEDTTLPQLLIKTQFASSSYTVFLTDLTNIWSEELDFPGIVRRASDVESPIEVSERDASQLDILFENVQKSLSHSNDSTSVISSDKLDNVILCTTISLPEPLDSLTWKFHLAKGTAAALKNELILPLLISSHVQHVRISRLISVITAKDRAITRLVDQYESSNLDLVAAFPNIGNAKSGKRTVRREQAARHIPGLQTFDPDIWKRETAEMVDTDVSTLGLFQEALSECTLRIPSKLRSRDDGEADWWNDLETSASVSKRAATTRAESHPKPAPFPSRPTAPDSETEEEGTEDEFETHENFNTRELTKKSEPPATLDNAPHEDDTTADDAMGVDQEDEEDDENLDAPPKVHSQSQRSPPRRKVSSPKISTPKIAPPVRADSPPAKPKAKGFKIGGRSKKTNSPPVMSAEETSTSQLQNDDLPTRSKVDEGGIGNRPVKRGFKIGGRARPQTPTGIEESPSSEGSRARRDTSAITQSPLVEPSASATTKVETQESPVEEERKETEEEKVERKRRELKRKNEELAKKQAQIKKKKRF